MIKFNKKYSIFTYQKNPIRIFTNNAINNTKKNNLVAWKKFILLPTILFSSLPNKSARYKEIEKRINLIKKDDWKLFNLNFFNPRFGINHSSFNSDQKEKIISNVNGDFTLSQFLSFKHLQEGHISKASNK